MLSTRDSFKVGFLSRCVEEGVAPEDIGAVIEKTSAALDKVAGSLEKVADRRWDQPAWLDPIGDRNLGPDQRQGDVRNSQHLGYDGDVYHQGAPRGSQSYGQSKYRLLNDLATTGLSGGGGYAVGKQFGKGARGGKVGILLGVLSSLLARKDSFRHGVRHGGGLGEIQPIWNVGPEATHSEKGGSEKQGHVEKAAASLDKHLEKKALASVLLRLLPRLLQAGARGVQYAGVGTRKLGDILSQHPSTRNSRNATARHADDPEALKSWLRPLGDKIEDFGSLLHSGGGHLGRQTDKLRWWGKDYPWRASNRHPPGPFRQSGGLKGGTGAALGSALDLATGMSLANNRRYLGGKLGLHKDGSDKQAGILSDVMSVPGALIDTVSRIAAPVLGAATGYGIPLALLAPPAAGAAVGYGAARAGDISDEDVEAIRVKELINEYRLQADKAERDKKVRKYRQKRNRTGRIFL